MPEYYILHREPERQALLTRTAAGVYVPLAPQDGVIRSRVLPGLQFRLADLCRRPEHGTLRDDPVYAGYVLPGWRAAEQRAAAATELAAAAAERAAVATECAATEQLARHAAEQRAAAEAQARLAAEEQAREATRALAELRAQLADRGSR